MSPATKADLPLDPLAATIHLRIEELRAEAHSARRARDARTRAGLPWPSAVVAALRDTVARATAGRPGQVCPTC
jgi:hypothetical protein